MQQDPLQHQQRYSQRRVRRGVSTDGFVPRTRVQPAYKRRAKGILPATDAEYMISLGSRASRRDEQLAAEHVSPLQQFVEKCRRQLYRFLQQALQLGRRRPSLALFGVAAILVFAVALIGVMRSDESAIANQDLQQILEDNGDTPSEKMPYGRDEYATAPDVPRLLTIRKIGVNTRVTRLGVRENSDPKSPTNIYDVGWYENSAKPGDKGAALFIGHIRGAEKQGVFHDLTNLVPGDELQLELGDGTIKHYYIVKMQAYDRNNVDFQELMTSAVKGKPGLNLLTAVGAFRSNSDVVQQLGVFAVEKTSAVDDSPAHL